MRDSYKYFTNLPDYWEIEMAQKLVGSGGLHNVCRISLYGWLLWQFPQTMRNSKLLEFALVCWIFLIIYFLVHLLTRSSTCPSILTDRCCAHDNQIGLIAFALPSCPNNSIRDSSMDSTHNSRRTVFNHLLRLWGWRPQYVHFSCKLNIGFPPPSLRFSRAKYLC